MADEPLESQEFDYGDVKDWICAIQLQMNRSQKKWWKKADKVVKRYRDERETEGDSSKRFNILWSNTETLKPALYANIPKPEVARRYKDADPTGRQASEILERALSYSVDAYDFDGEVRSAVEDYLLPGRATIRVRYKPTYGEEVQPKTRLIAIEEGFFHEDGMPVSPDSEIVFDEEGAFLPGEPYTPVVYEEAECEYVYWKDFLCGPGKRWNDVNWVAFAAYMDRNELVDRFGEKGRLIKLDCKPDDLDRSEKYEKYNMEHKAKIWEIWDKRTRTVRWVSETYENDFLDAGPPPLDLNGFYPCAKPLYAVKTNNSMDPIPEFCEYQDQANEIDVLTRRISKLVPQIKVCGAYPGESKETLGRLLTEGTENQLVPVDSWAMFAERGGIQGMISWMPIDQVVSAVLRLYEAREQTKQELYEITGIADIIRGASNAAETATAQRIKGQFATLRLSDRQKQISFFVRDLLRLKAEVMCEHFSEQTFAMMTGIMPTPEVMDLFRNDPARGFRIDIETDSTLMADEEMDKKSRIEFLEATTNFIGTLMPIAEQAPALAPLFGEMILFGVRGFKAGRQLEESVEKALETMQQQAQQAQQQPPQPDPKQIEAQAKAQKMQQDMQMEQAKFQSEEQRKQAELQSDIQLDQQRLANDARVQDQELALKRYEVEEDLELQRLKARLGNL